MEGLFRPSMRLFYERDCLTHRFQARLSDPIVYVLRKISPSVTTDRYFLLRGGRTERYEKSPAEWLGILNGARSIPPWSWWTDSNPRPADYKSAALPTELHQRISRIQHPGVLILYHMEKGCVKSAPLLLCRGKQSTSRSCRLLPLRVFNRKMPHVS